MNSVVRVVTPEKRQGVTPEKRQGTFCRTRREEGKDACRCHKAIFSQDCQVCGRPIRLGDCVLKFPSGWGHIECPGDNKRGLQSIENNYQKVHHIDLFVEDGKPSSVTSDLMEVGKRLSYYVPRQIASKFDEEDQSTSGSCIHGEGNEDDIKPPPRKLAKTEHNSCDNNHSSGEQKRILAYEPETGEVVCVNALAGCGKTTTIAHLCNEICAKDPTKKLLYLVYNKKNEHEAKESKKMPKSTEIRTTHAFVLRHYFGTDHMHNVRPVGEYELKHIISSLELERYCQHTFKHLFESRDKRKVQRRLNVIAGFIRKTVQKFQASSDANVQVKHVFWRARYSSYSSNKRSKWQKKINEGQYVSWASQFFKQVRERCETVKNGGDGVGITYDGYLKVAQIENMQIPFDVIMVDEAQDMTPCQADLFWGDHQRDGSIIYLFGDIHQKLYRFRGAGDSFHDKLKELTTTPAFSLTESFRFGKKIAAYASCVLEAISGEELIGLAKFEGSVQEDDMNKGVVLCRTNNGMYQFLHSHRPRRWCYLSGSSKQPPGPTTDQLLLEKYLAEESGEEDDFDNDDVPKPKEFNYKGEAFWSIEEIKEFAQDEDDLDLLRSLDLLSFLKTENKDISSFFQEIQSSFCKLGKDEAPDDYDGVILGTVHKAKGLEFDNVLIFDDYNFDRIEECTQGRVTPFDEVHIFYVAITRTRKNLFLSTRAHKCLEDLAKRNKIPLPTLVTSKSLRKLRSKWGKEWKYFKEKTPTIKTIDDIPWPPNWNCPRNCLALDRDMSNSKRRHYINKIRRAYHPDKFLPKRRKYVLHIEDQIKDRLQEIMGNCVRCTEQQHPEFDSNE